MTSRRTKRAVSAARRAVLGVGLAAVVSAPVPAFATPSDCWTKRISDDTYEGGCRSGTGLWRMTVNCDTAEPDGETDWKNPGQSARVTCWWGDARSADIELRD